MRKVNNLTNNSTLKKFQNQWVAFDEQKNVVAASTSFLKLNELIGNAKQDNIEITFINASNLYLAPFNGCL